MAVAFIGGAELAASYWLDPPIFHKIVDPIMEKTAICGALEASRCVWQWTA